MTIRRQYSLPNCTLILEGLSNEMGGEPQDGQLLSIVVNAECKFVGFDRKLHGGRVFVENLVKSTSAYAQECLSGIRRPHEVQATGDRVNLEIISGTTLHRLSWHPPEEANEEPIELELNTVQLFDLVEAVDQFVADTRTLPDLTLKLQPVSRRYRQPDEPLAQRAVPATMGMISLAVAALAFLLIPIPQVRKPEETKPQPNPTQTAPNTQPSLPAASPNNQQSSPASPTPNPTPSP
ncbi:DUF4335 domain-containing protein [Candidatus Gracilibacteria bacterium]|nr:DUF4335 domain-containing protein [Candidatus Gracilibacteria bacterium]NJP21373.1 DUF4335 domain-containing protein [Hydrococcus sp. CRU_1_1]